MSLHKVITATPQVTVPWPQWSAGESKDSQKSEVNKWDSKNGRWKLESGNVNSWFKWPVFQQYEYMQGMVPICSLSPSALSESVFTVRKCYRKEIFLECPHFYQFFRFDSSPLYQTADLHSICMSVTNICNLHFCPGIKMLEKYEHQCKQHGKGSDLGCSEASEEYEACTFNLQTQWFPG